MLVLEVVTFDFTGVVVNVGRLVSVSEWESFTLWWILGFLITFPFGFQLRFLSDQPLFLFTETISYLLVFRFGF